MKFETLRLEEIAPNEGQIEGLPRNPRTWTIEDVQKLARSLEETPELLEARGLIVYPLEGNKYVTIGGNMRLAALNHLGRETAPCVLLEESTSGEKLREIALKDNSSFGAWDPAALLGEWPEIDLEGWGIKMEDITIPEARGQVEEDIPPELDDTPERVKTGEIWQMGTHRLICGDSSARETIARLMGTERAALYLTDPPYNVDYQGHRTQREKIEGDKQTPEEYTRMLIQTIKAAAEHLQPGAPWYIWHASAALRELHAALDAAGWKERQTLIWVKSNHVIGWGDYNWQHEPCLYGWTEGGTHYFTSRRGERTVTDDRPPRPDTATMTKAELRTLAENLLDAQEGAPSTVINAAKPLASEHHPTTKPVKLFGKLVDNSSRPGDIVLDSYAGSGTTMAACEQLGRRAFLAEISPRFCDVILARYEALTGNAATKIGE